MLLVVYHKGSFSSQVISDLSNIFELQCVEINKCISEVVTDIKINPSVTMCISLIGETRDASNMFQYYFDQILKFAIICSKKNYIYLPQFISYLW